MSTLTRDEYIKACENAFINKCGGYTDLNRKFIVVNFDTSNAKKIELITNYLFIKGYNINKTYKSGERTILNEEGLTNIEYGLTIIYEKTSNF